MIIFDGSMDFSGIETLNSIIKRCEDKDVSLIEVPLTYIKLARKSYLDDLKEYNKLKESTDSNNVNEFNLNSVYKNLESFSSTLLFSYPYEKMIIADYLDSEINRFLVFNKLNFTSSDGKRISSWAKAITEIEDNEEFESTITKQLFSVIRTKAKSNLKTLNKAILNNDINLLDEDIIADLMDRRFHSFNFNKYVYSKSDVKKNLEIILNYFSDSYDKLKDFNVFFGYNDAFLAIDYINEVYEELAKGTPAKLRINNFTENDISKFNKAALGVKNFDVSESISKRGTMDDHSLVLEIIQNINALNAKEVITKIQDDYDFTKDFVNYNSKHKYTIDYIQAKYDENK